MSKENVEAFIRKVEADPVLKERALKAGAEQLGGLIQLATEVGLPFTEAEFKALVATPPPSELTDGALALVAGGRRPECNPRISF
jgi:predicted ribosomally synthesized peptide with nif11-like leader